jgi:hypothetical protein
MQTKNFQKGGAFMEENKKTASSAVLPYKPVLCFGTFFILLCQSRNNLGIGKRDRFNAEQREVSEAEVFNALMQVVYGNDSYSVSSHGEGVFKQCVKTKKVPCQHDTILKNFNLKFDTAEGCKALIVDVEKKLLPLLDTEKDESLLRSIIALLATAVCDSSDTKLFDESHEFQISEIHKRSIWKLVNEEQQISLPHFILDVYRYILNECSDNTVGNATYEEWCPRAEGAAQNSQRPFVKGPDTDVIRKTHSVYRPKLNDRVSGLPDAVDENYDDVLHDDRESSCAGSSHDTAANATTNSVQQSVTQVSVTQIGNGIQIAEVSGGTFNFNLGRS